jgi:hypothetical protein
MTTFARWFTTPLVALVLLVAACGGDDPGTDDTSGPTSAAPDDVATLDDDAPSIEELEACLATNGFEPEVDTDSPVYGVGQITVTIEVPGFPAPGAGRLHVFATAEEAATTFPDIAEDALAPIERHRNTVLSELGVGALNEEGAGEVRSRMEACIGPTDEVGGPEA